MSVSVPAVPGSVPSDAPGTLKAVSLNDVARGTASSAATRILAVEILESGDPVALLDFYHAMRTWVWRAMDARRGDPDLCNWHDILGGTASMVSRMDPVLGARFSTLKELVGESIATRTRMAAFGRRKGVSLG